MIRRHSYAVILAMLGGLGAACAQPETPARPGLMVICPAAWVGAMAPYVQAREAFFEVRCLALEDLLAGNNGADAPERVKRLLYRAWRSEGLRYVLLVGDADTFPVRWMVLDRVTEPAYHYAFYASDLYYADVAKDDGSFEDWNAQVEGFHGVYYGEVRGEHFKTDPINYDAISYVPEIAVGRWPVSTVAELQTVIAKTLEWERTARAIPRALIAHADGWVDERERLGKLANALANDGWEVDRQFYGGEIQQPTPQTVRDAILAGKDLVLHAGHGNGESWDRCLGPAEREALTAASPGIFMSVGCGTGRFAVEPPYEAYLDAEGILHRGTNDGEVFIAEPPAPAPLQPGRLNPTGLGERLLRMPRSGAVAYIGCSTGAQPCALSLLDGFVLSIANGAPRVGDAWREALAHYWQAERLADLQPNEDWYPPSIFFQGMKFMLFGDPALSLPGR